MERTIRVLTPTKPTTTLDSNVELEFEGTVPDGYVLSDIEIMSDVSVVTVPTTATRHHALFKSITGRNEVGATMTIKNAKALPMACLATQSMKDTSIYEPTPRATDCVRDPLIAAAGTKYFAVYKLHCPMSGKVHSIKLELAEPDSAIPGITGIQASFAVCFVYTKEATNMPMYVMSADQLQLTEVSFNNVRRGAIYSDSILSDAASSIVFGSDIGQSVQKQLEDQFNDQLRGLGANGPATDDTRTLPVLNPGTNSSVFGLMRKLERSGPIRLSMTSSTEIGFVLLATSGQVEGLVNKAGS